MESDVDVTSEDFRENLDLALIDFVPAFCGTGSELAEQMLRRVWRMQFISAHGNRPGEPAVLGDGHGQRLTIAELPDQSIQATAAMVLDACYAGSPGFVETLAVKMDPAPTTFIGFTGQSTGRTATAFGRRLLEPFLRLDEGPEITADAVAEAARGAWRQIWDHWEPSGRWLLREAGLVVIRGFPDNLTPWSAVTSIGRR